MYSFIPRTPRALSPQVAHENSQLRARMRQMGAAQTLLQSRVDNLETVVLVDEEEDDAAAAAAASEGSSS